MTTRDRLIRYRELQKTSERSASQFLQENSSDERFVSLVKIGDKAIAEVKGYLDSYKEIVGSQIQITSIDDEFIKCLADLIRGIPDSKINRGE